MKQRTINETYGFILPLGARGRSILGREGSAVGDSTGPRLLSEYTRAECDNSQAIHENHLESQAVLVNRLDSEWRADAARDLCAPAGAHVQRCRRQRKESERCTGIARDCSLGNIAGELKSHSLEGYGGFAFQALRSEGRAT